MNELITSNQNNKVKYLKKLYSSSKRKKEGKFILEGYRLIKQAFQSNAKFNYIFVTPDYKKSKRGKKLLENKNLSNRIVNISYDLLENITDTVTPQGIVAIVEEIDYRIDEILKNGKKILILDKLQDPGNMGTIIRTAAAAGFDGIISLKGSVDIYNLKVIRSTAGAIFNIPFVNKLSYTDFENYLDQEFKNFQLICTDPASDSYYYENDFKDNILLVIGNEANGIRDSITEKADVSVKIPLNSNIESINAAIAAGVLMYNIKYQ